MSSIFDGIGDDGVEQLDENLRKWFKEKWVRFGPDGKIRGACARGSDKEGKPKCLPQKKAQALGKKGRKYAASKKRREDPNPERRGPAKNVATKKNEDIQVNEKWSQKYKDSINCSNPKGFSQKAHCAGKKKNEDMNEGIPFNQCPKCRGPIVHESMMNEKQDACYHKVKSRYKVWPSAYASGALVQCRKKGASNWGTGAKKNESNIMKGLVAENEMIYVIYIDGHPLVKYVDKTRANTDAERVKKKFPNKNVEVRHEMHEAANPAQQAAIAISKKERGEKPKNEGVIIGHDKDDPDVAIIGGAGTYKLSNVKKKAQMEANELAKDIMDGKYKNSAYNVKQLANTLNTIVAAEDEMEKLYFGEDSSMEFAVEKTPAINPYGGLKDRQFRGAIGEALLSEMPTDNPTGASGEGGWRKYKPKPAGELDEDTAYAGGGGQGGNAGQSYRKFKPKSAGTFKEDKSSAFQDGYNAWKDYLSGKTKQRPTNPYPAGQGMGEWENGAASASDHIDWRAGARDYGDEELDEACWKGYHKEGNKKMFGKTYPNCVKNTNEGTETKWEVAIEYGPTAHHTAKIKVSAPDEDTAQNKALALFKKKYPDRRGMVGDCTKVNEEQLDEKCWDTHKQVGMKKKGGKSVPNCVPKESAIMKGLTGKRR